LNFSVVGLLGALPCTVSGTANAITLTGATNNPTVASYSNYLRFSAIAALTNTGAVTAQYGALAVLNVYKDTNAGPVVLAGNEITANTAFELVYDSTLNSNAGGFHLVVSTSNVGNISPTNINCSGVATIGTLDVTGAASVVGPASMASLTVHNVITGAGGASISSGVSVGTLVVNGSAPVTRINTFSGTVTFSVLLANTSQDVAATVSGVQVGDAVMVGPPATNSTGLALMGYVPANGTITLRALNVTASSITAPTGIYRLVAIGFT
jgi:hypothetical protein